MKILNKVVLLRPK